jgi:hypothetical protein
MAIEAPYSKFKKTNLKIYIAVCIVFAIWFGYDGYFNEKFRKEHAPNGVPDGTLVFNQKSPPFFIGLAVLLGVYLFVKRNKKVIADENELIIGGKDRMSYDSILKIDKTYFKSKGYFLVTYKDKDGHEANRKLSRRTYDNLKAVLDELVAKIT